MSINTLNLSNFRNIKNTNLEFSPKANFFYGLNGSGKSSLLEALFFLSRGCSFKQNYSKNLINFNKKDFSIYSTINNFVNIGINYSLLSKLKIKINDSFISSSFTLSQYISLQILSPDSSLLIESSPTIRRKYIDWIVFHVKHNLHSKWKRYRLILKNRNVSLKNKLTKDEINAWDNEFISITNDITIYRKEYINTLNVYLKKYRIEFLSDMEIYLEFYQGWNTKISYKECLHTNFVQDFNFGFTQSGLHKADIKIKIRKGDNSYLVKDILSKGLIKYISLILYIIQIKIYQENESTIENYTKPILLVDDINSELDNNYTQLIFNFINQLNIQMFITLLDTDNNMKLINTFTSADKIEYKMFHVEHGIIKEKNKIEK